MQCPKCGGLLESSTDGDRAFKLQYGKHYEPTSICSAGCPGLWTKTSIGLYQEMMQMRRRRARATLEEQPAPEH